MSDYEGLENSINLHIQDEKQRLGRSDYYGIREVLNDKLDLKVGIVKASSIRYYFNKLYDAKHVNDLVSPEENEGLKVYTFARYISRFYDVN